MLKLLRNKNLFLDWKAKINKTNKIQAAQIESFYLIPETVLSINDYPKHIHVFKSEQLPHWERGKHSSNIFLSSFSVKIKELK